MKKYVNAICIFSKEICILFDRNCHYICVYHPANHNVIGGEKEWGKRAEGISLLYS